MKDHPLAQSIYTFSYLYDREWSSENPYILALVDSVNVVGNYFMEMSKQNLSMRDDDNTFPLFGFAKDISDHPLIQKVMTSRYKLF